MSERRDFSRADCNVEATLNHQDANLPSKIINLSLNSALISTSAAVKAGDDVTITISFTDGDGPLTVHCAGQVIRRDTRGVAVKFGQLDLQTVAGLRKIVAAHSSEPEVIFDEYSHLMQRRSAGS